ncbi:beta-ketoacyl-ACP synthase III [Candidatus Cyanaurora vandensis]|uniref:beta-ketoacyl-ACP synthase III n=1 Tax=Candidatus Cyanaurora vandensis TaxID=2714958 RepID=UPI00257E0DDB|nr:beta-ketoacyl-ACP synthase III [Candidatus Cyanaurora vandensis]
MTQALTGIQFTGVGKSLPQRVLTNDQLATVVETSDEWIHSRTGIRERRVLGPTENLLDLALAASEQALCQAGLTALDLDLVILATSTPEDLFGSASRVAARLGAVRAVAFDLTAACTGFVFAVGTAAQFLRTGCYRTALVVAADGLTRWLDWQDRNTCVLFGDGAGAMVLEACPVDQLLGLELRSDGRGADMLTLPTTGETVALMADLAVRNQQYAPIYMNGRDVYRFAVREVPVVIEKALHRAQLRSDQVDCYVLHQANQRILDAVAERLQVPPDRFATTLDRYANTSAASVPITLCEGWESGQIRSGSVLVMAGFGAGLTWGALVCRWGRVSP